MKDKNIINISLLCSTVFVVGVSLNIPVPFYPKEALHKGISVTQSGRKSGVARTKEIINIIDFITQIVHIVRQSDSNDHSIRCSFDFLYLGIVISIIYLFNLILTPICGKYLESLGTQRVLLVGIGILGVGKTLEYSATEVSQFLDGHV